MKLRYILFAFFTCFQLNFASLSNEAVIMPAMTENLLHVSAGVNLSDIKKIPDLYFECQIAHMSEKLAIPLFYNPMVREYIEIFLMERKTMIPALSLLSNNYFPLFETQLENYELPDELKYIAVIESALDPLACSSSGALGLWQFKAETGRSFGLIVNQTIDERSDPVKSTKAACDYLRYLNEIFGNWQLSLMAYHAGPSTIKNAIKKAGGKTSVDALTNFLPVPTQRYLPSYIAMIYVLNNYKNHI